MLTKHTKQKCTRLLRILTMGENIKVCRYDVILPQKVLQVNTKNLREIRMTLTWKLMGTIMGLVT